MHAGKWSTPAVDAEPIVCVTPVRCPLFLGHLRAECGRRTQPRAAYAGEKGTVEREVDSLDFEELGVCRRRDQGVEVVVSQA